MKPALAYLVAASLGLIVTTSSCGTAGPCSPATCSSGCCDSAGVCQPGLTSTACGDRGAVCATCSLGDTCTGGVCRNVTGGTGGGTVGVGGGSAQGGGSTAGGAAAGGSAVGGGSTAGGSAVGGGSTAGGSAAGGSAGGGTATVSFTTQVGPLIRMRCGGCHGLSSVAAANTFVRGTPERMPCMASQTARIVAGHADDSLIVKKVSGTQPCGARMPFGCTPGADCLTDTQINLIRDWVNAGAPNN